jgi:death on curing protein
MSRIPLVDRISNNLSDVYVEIFFQNSPEIITRQKIMDIQVKQILASTEEGDKNCEGLLLDPYTLDNILDKWYEWINTPDCIVFSAYILHSITTMHPFIQGNKRTAFVTATLILGCCGKTINCPDSEIVSFMKSVAKSEQDPKSVEEWIAAHVSEEYGYKRLKQVFRGVAKELYEIKERKKKAD